MVFILVTRVPITVMYVLIVLLALSVLVIMLFLINNVLILALSFIGKIQLIQMEFILVIDVLGTVMYVQMARLAQSVINMIIMLFLTNNVINLVL